MRRALRILRRVGIGLAWLLVLTALGLLAVEESGVLAKVARERLAKELGPVGEQLSIGRASLRWFDPALVLEEVSLRGPADGPELIRLRRVRIGFERDARHGFSPTAVELDGGLIFLSRQLQESAQRIAEARQLTAGEGAASAVAPPPLLASDIDLVLETPSDSRLALGRIEFVVRAESTERLETRGRFWPSLSGGVPSDVSVGFEGHSREGAELSLHAATESLPFDSDGLRDPFRDELGLARLAGELRLDATLDMVLVGDTETRLTLRTSVKDGLLQTTAEEAPLEDMSAELRLSFEPEGDEWIWSAGAWSVRSSLEAEWRDTSLRAWGLLGDDTPGGALARVWGRTAELRLTPELPSALHIEDELGDDWEALAPEGRVDASFDVELPAPAAGEPFRLDLARYAARFRVTGNATITVHGWVNEFSGDREGLPLPMRSIRGDALFVHDAVQPRPDRLALLDLRGDASGGRATASGLICSPLPGDWPADDLKPEIDLVLDAVNVAVDDRLRAGLAGNKGTESIFDDFAPAGGTVSASWRYRLGPEIGGASASGDVRVNGVDFAWSELPLPIRDASGTVRIRWARLPTPVVDSRRLVRPVGVTYELESRPERGLAVRLEGASREESTGREPIVLQQTPRPPISELRITLDSLPLRGDDWNALAATYPDIGAEIAELRAKGQAHVVFHGRRAHPDLAYRGDLEARPLRVELTPAEFPRRTDFVLGRILTTWITTESSDGTEVTESDVRYAFTGRWTPDVELAVSGATAADGAGVLRLLAGGIDPSNAGTQGALATAFGAEPGEAGVDLSGFDVTGRLDYQGLRRYAGGEEKPVESTHRIHLRGNRLTVESLRLDALHGALEQEGDVLRGARVEARLADTPLELRDLLVYRLVLPGGSLADDGGFALQANLHLDDLPLDEEHLGRLLSPEQLEYLPLGGESFGAVDVRGARFVITSGTDDHPGLAALRGRIVPHGLSLSLGVPIHVTTAEIDIRELISEHGRLRGWGRIDDLRGQIADRDVEDASMILTYRDRRLTIDELAGGFAGGRLASLGGEERGGPALGIDLAPPYRFEVDVRLIRVPAQHLLTGLFETSDADRGRISAQLRLNGTPDRVRGLTGVGSVRIAEAQLWSIPVMRELFSQLGFDRTAVFQGMQARFQLYDGVVLLPELRVQSPLLNLVGSGSMDLDGRLRCDLEVRYSIVDRLGPLNQLLYWLNNNLWQVAIRGDMARPRVIVRNWFYELLNGFDDNPRRELPLPDFEELPARF
jgi:hypothetical protein